MAAAPIPLRRGTDIHLRSVAVQAPGARTLIASRFRVKPDYVVDEARSGLAAQDLQHVLELDPQLTYQLLRLRHVLSRVLAIEPIARTTDGESLLV